MKVPGPLSLPRLCSHESAQLSGAQSHHREYAFKKYPTIYGRTMNLMRQLRDEYDAVLSTYDVLVMPTVSQPARRHIPPESGPLTCMDMCK